MGLLARMAVYGCGVVAGAVTGYFATKKFDQEHDRMAARLERDRYNLRAAADVLSSMELQSEAKASCSA